ncbi:hypothetical protein JKF63_05557 [Porcisia hertigi]|uniref:Uncharacterized protein n=1 Tax=Porcisia hertigi TaxID=2761500 RepID=A0A836ILF9_9TRYP|nr:hypothetical protein JKF63_05557 [Porcisia hertigi]
MSSHIRLAEGGLAPMSDEEEDDVSEDLELTFVPASKRSAVASSCFVSHRARNATCSALTSSTGTSTLASEPKPRTETVYEQERNAKARQVLAEHQRKAQGALFSLDTFEALLPAPYGVADFPDMTGVSPSLSTSAPYQQDGQRRGLSQYRGRGGTEFGGRGGPGGRGGGRRHRLPNPNMSEEEQARYIRHRRNMAVTRNALREVDPETLEYMEVTQAPDQVPLNRGREGFSAPSFSTNRGRGGFDAGGGGGGMSSYRGRGTGSDWRGRGGNRFSSAPAVRGSSVHRGEGLGRGGGGSSASFRPF